MTHWRHQYDHGLSKLKRLDARFDRALKLVTIALSVAFILTWRFALS